MDTLKKHSLGKALGLHLLPGVLATLAYLVWTPGLLRSGYPALLALLLAAGLILIPLELGYLLWAGRQVPGQPVIGLRQPLPVWQSIVLPVGMVLWAFLASGLLSGLDLYVARAWFGWLPDWFFFLDVEQFTGFSRPALLVTFWVGLLVNGLAGPIVEELYFRGHLLPRLPAPGNWPVVLNITLFSLYHFWSPWQFLSRIIWLWPWGYLVWKKQNFSLMLIAHSAGNTLGWLLTWSLILGRA